jgi:hypothetical protein
VIKFPKKKKAKIYFGDVPPKWFNVMTVILVLIAFVFLAWSVVSIVGCANTMVDYAKAKNPGCNVLKVSEKACGTEVILKCPYGRFETICLSKHN